MRIQVPRRTVLLGFVLVSMASASKASGMSSWGYFDVRKESEKSDVVLVGEVVGVDLVAGRHEATVRCEQVLKGLVKPGEETRVAYPSHAPNEDGINSFALDKGRTYLLFLRKRKGDAAYWPGPGWSPPWAMPNKMPKLEAESLLGRLEEVAVTCLGCDDQEVLAFPVEVADGIEVEDREKNPEIARLYSRLDALIRKRARELAPPPPLMAYVLLEDLRRGEADTILATLLFLRRCQRAGGGAWFLPQRQFGLIREPKDRALLLALLLGQDPEIVRFVAIGMEQWGDRTCVPFLIEAMRGVSKAQAARDIEHVLVLLAKKEEASSLQERPILPLKGDLERIEERLARAQLWEDWWKPVWVKNAPKDDKTRTDQGAPRAVPEAKASADKKEKDF